MRRGYPRGPLLFAVGVSTLVFTLVYVLELAVYTLLEPEYWGWSILMAVRRMAPGVFIVVFFVAGLLPGIVTGLMVMRGRALPDRILNGVIWAPISLCLFSTGSLIVFYVFWSDQLILVPSGQKLQVTGGRIVFSLFSNIFGGAAGGLIVGGVVHAAVEAFSQLKIRGSAPGKSITRRPSRRR